MDPSNQPSDLTPKHVRAARALLAWSQKDLAKAAGVATSTIADFERGQRTPVANSAHAIRGALEGAGIRFLPTGAVVGPAVPKLVAAERTGTPVRWVASEDLSAWANRIEAASTLPTLLSHLIQATHGSALRLRFPSDDGVRHPGWDGYTSTDTGSDYVPAGAVGWEFSTQRSNIEQKANKDYRKRTADPEDLDPASSAFIFVTLHHWPKKNTWAKARQDEGPWREVRVYDSDDLVHWIERAPAVGLWLTTRLGLQRQPGIRELEEVWEEWSLATKWPLTADLVLSDRDQDAADVLRWLRGEPSVLSLQSTTADEVVAFFHATLSELPPDVADAYRARCLVATDAAAARALANAPAPLILLLTDPEPGLAQRLAQRGHYVLQAYGERLVALGDVRTLARPSREGIASALTAAGIAEPRARALARDSARNLAVLRRLIPAAPGRLPGWAEAPPPRALLAALLVTGWDENTEGDRKKLSEVAGQSFEALVAALAPYVGDFDSPLKKIGLTWRIASPIDAWFHLAHHLTGADLSRFEIAAIAVLGSEDPRFDLDPDERWMAPIHGVHPNYSEMLRRGIGQVLILLALWGDRVRAVPDAGRRPEVIVSKLLGNADRRRWWSLSDDLRLLAEASPDAFLQAIEDSLDQNVPPITVLFGHDEGGAFGGERLSDLMWALESLAWSPKWMPRVTHVLARLDAIDTKPRRYTNGPAESLRKIHLLWNPQTQATLDQRLRALDLVRKRENGAAWKLMIRILPQGREILVPSPMPLWRDFSVDKVETVTWALMGRGAAAISERLLDDVGLDPERWSEVLKRIGDLPLDPERALEALEAVEPQVTDKDDRAVFWERLRRVLHRHRSFASAEWSYSDAILERLESVYDRFAPTDPIERTAWLFQHSVRLPRPSAAGWEATARDVGIARQQAAHALYADGGLPAVLSVARLTEAPDLVGKALYDAGLPASDVDVLLEAAARSDHANERDVAHGLIVSAFRDRKEPWATALIAKAKAESWGDMALLTILGALPIRRWTWDRVAQIGGEIERKYWCRMPVLWMSDDSPDVVYAIRMLISAGRAVEALSLAGRGDKVYLPTDLLVEMLQEAARQPAERNGDANALTMFQHHVAEILKTLDARNDVERSKLVELEWKYLGLLEHSERPATVLPRMLSEQPALFINMLSAVYRASDESGVVEPEPEDLEQARRFAEQAYRLLYAWNHIPGTRDDGTIDGDALKAWLIAVRRQAKAVGRQDVADKQIGNLLSASPMGSDGNWPAEPIREVLDQFRSEAMVDGFRSGKRNRRGLTLRNTRDGGELERQEAAKYRGWAEVIADEYPRTARALDELAESYEWQARGEDEKAERFDWIL